MTRSRQIIKKLKWQNLCVRQTEDLNKFWTWKFRTYIRKNRYLLLSERASSWWADFLDRRKKPGNKCASLSSVYSKKFDNSKYTKWELMDF
jgi:hypothetical protein